MKISTTSIRKNWKYKHKYFDTFDWTIDEHNNIIVDKKCEDYEWLKQYENKCIRLNNENNKYIKWYYKKFTEKIQKS